MDTILQSFPFDLPYNIMHHIYIVYIYIKLRPWNHIVGQTFIDDHQCSHGVHIDYQLFSLNGFSKCAYIEVVTNIRHK